MFSVFNDFFYLNSVLTVLMFEHAIHSDYDSIILLLADS